MKRWRVRWHRAVGAWVVHYRDGYRAFDSWREAIDYADREARR